MRTLLLPLLFLVLFIPKTVAQDDMPSALTDALVTLRVDGLDDAGWGRIASRIGREPDANIEYGCVRSGIVVLRFRALRSSEKADALAVVKRLLDEAGIKGSVSFLDVHMEQKANNKC